MAGASFGSGTGYEAYTSVDGILKDFYGPKIFEALNRRNWALDRLRRRTNLQFSGRKYVFPVHDRANTGVGFRGELGYIPSAGAQRHQQAEVTDSSIYGTIQSTGLGLDAVRSDKGGWQRTLDTEMRGLVKDITDHMGQAVYHMPVLGSSSSLNAVRAKVTAVAGVGPCDCTLTAPGGYSSAPAGFGATRYLRVGDIIAWGTQGQLHGGTPDGYGTITAVTGSTQVITVDSITGNIPALNDYIVRGDQNASGHYEYDNGFNGLGSLTSDGQAGATTFEALTLTTGSDYTWNNVKKTSAGPFDEMEIHSLINSVEEVGSGETSVLVSHISLQMEYLASLQGQTRYKDDSFKGGYRSLDFASGRQVTWVADKYAPYGHLFALDEKAIEWAVRRELGWEETNGIVKSMLILGQDAVRAVYRGRMQMMWTSLNAHGVLSGVSVSGTVL